MESLLFKNTSAQKKSKLFAKHKDGERLFKVMFKPVADFFFLHHINTSVHIIVTNFTFLGIFPHSKNKFFDLKQIILLVKSFYFYFEPIYTFLLFFLAL